MAHLRFGYIWTQIELVEADAVHLLSFLSGKGAFLFEVLWFPQTYRMIALSVESTQESAEMKSYSRRAMITSCNVTNQIPKGVKRMVSLLGVRCWTEFARMNLRPSKENAIR